MSRKFKKIDFPTNIKSLLIKSISIYYFCISKPTNMKYLFAIALLGVALLSSCRNQNSPDVSEVNPLIEIGHFDHRFFAIDSTQFDEDLIVLKRDFPSFFEIDHDATVFKKRYDDPQVRELYTSVDSIYSNTDVLDDELRKAFKYFYHHFPSHDSLKLYTWISNFESLEPVIVSGNTLLIALDLYLGEESHFYKTAPAYIKYGFDKSFILSDVFQSYFSAYIPLMDDNSLLASMIHYGKIHYLSALMLPDAAPELIMTYPGPKMEWCFANEGNIWAYFIDNNLLFSTHQQNKQRFIEDAPFSKFYTSFDSDTPGRIGQWIGWRIVSSYMSAHPETSLSDLIKEQDAQKILRESRYKPKQ